VLICLALPYVHISCPAAVDDSIYMLPEVELPPVLRGLPDSPSDIQPELKKLVQGVVLQAGGLLTREMVVDTGNGC
jgi:hypothetical protein